MAPADPETHPMEKPRMHTLLLDDPLAEYETAEEHRLHAEFARLVLAYHHARSGSVHFKKRRQMNKARRWEAMADELRAAIEHFRNGGVARLVA